MPGREKVIEIKSDSSDKPRPTITHVVTCSGFPDKPWSEWELSCKDEFGDCRWMKMWMDHKVAQQHHLLQSLMAEISAIKSRLDEIDKISIKEPKEKIETLGNSKKEDD
jgi:hypothetical protein